MTRFLGVDPGERRIGLAVSDPSGTIASPYGFIDVIEGAAVAEIATLVADIEADVIVVGLPIGLDGQEGRAARKSRELGRAIETDVDIDVVYWDERFTTVTAEQMLIGSGMSRKKRKNTRDQVAAAVMLQGYLDRLAHDRGNDDSQR